MNKKAIAILGAIFLLIVATLGFLIFQKYSSNGNTATNNNGQNSTTTPETTDVITQPEPVVTTPQGGSSLVKLSTEQVISPVLFFDGTGVTYFTPSGQLMQADISASGTVTTLERKRALEIPIKSNINKIIWPMMGRNFMAQLTQGAKKLYSFFNNQTGLYTDLPEQITSLDWSPAGDKIYYIWLENGKATLNVSDADTKNWKQIAEMWELDDTISLSPNGQNILYYRTANSEAVNNIYLTTPDAKIWRTLVQDGYNYGVLWSPDSQKFLFGKKDLTTQKYGLWYYDLLTGEVKNLGLGTLPEKAVWSPDSKTVYAAVPSVGSAGSGSLTQDIVVRIDTTTLEKKEFSGFNQQVDVQDMFLSKDGSKLYFRNGQDGYLYYLDLSK